jgi:hypothetical protein
MVARVTIKCQYINAVSGWRFDSIPQTEIDLRSDEELGSLLLKISLPLVMAKHVTISYSGKWLPGISALI